jgi:hypothetical protein
MGVVLMSKRELNRIDILARLESGRLTPGAAAALLQVSERQVYWASPFEWLSRPLRGLSGSALMFEG